MYQFTGTDSVPSIGGAQHGNEGNSSELGLNLGPSLQVLGLNSVINGLRCPQSIGRIHLAMIPSCWHAHLAQYQASMEFADVLFHVTCLWKISPSGPYYQFNCLCLCFLPSSKILWCCYGYNSANATSLAF